MGLINSRELLTKYANLSSKELLSQVFYYYLKNSYNNLNQPYEECKSLDSSYSKDPKILKICGKLVKHLKTNYEKLSDSDLQDHHCNLLSYWIYEELDKELKGIFPQLLLFMANFSSY
ncbi:hypothetical protein PVBG_06035 [Plasmodium vivax Brazil I]|uniref:PIR Superfamily Protein n=1 Tax=Plasmodium vivax (strain Brazil I) TaxID=1033975 RepID=A0A0J9SJN4_PLAV1|nr:hypothetical protein PVBG_06035 [Plasmodium vivax Brazil I]